MQQSQCVSLLHDVCPVFVELEVSRLSPFIVLGRIFMCFLRTFSWCCAGAGVHKDLFSTWGSSDSLVMALL